MRPLAIEERPFFWSGGPSLRLERSRAILGSEPPHGAAHTAPASLLRWRLGAPRVRLGVPNIGYRNKAYPITGDFIPYLVTELTNQGYAYLILGKRVRRKAPGMTSNSDRILELLEEKEVALSKRGIDVNLRREEVSMDYETVKKHVDLMNDLGLLQKYEETGGWYEITDEGEAYLHGKLDASAQDGDGNGR